MSQVTDYPYQVALPESYALKFERKAVHKDAVRLGARSIHSMARKAGIHFCVFSFSSKRSMSVFMRRHGGKAFGADGWERIVVR